jgi:hypothetical protein
MGDVDPTTRLYEVGAFVGASGVGSLCHLAERLPHAGEDSGAMLGELSMVIAFTHETSGDGWREDMVPGMDSDWPTEDASSDGGGPLEDDEVIMY